MNNRTAHDTKLHESVRLLKEHYALFETEFFAFFEQLQAEVERKKVELGI